MEVADLFQALWEPRGIVFVGASRDPRRVSGRAVSYLGQHDFAGAIHVVNPHCDVVQGLSTYRSLDDVPDPVDLAVISLPSPMVLEAVQACAKRGIGACIIYASGFAEAGDAGRRLQAQLAEQVAGGDMRVLGPNSLGLISVAGGVTATFTTALDKGGLPDGPVALVTQSGAFASFVFSLGRQEGVGFQFMANTGNEVDIKLGELLELAIEQDGVGVVLMHAEQIRDLDRFEAAAHRAHSLGKPIVIVKVGWTEVGAAAAAAHTGADAGNDDAYRELFARTGVHRVGSMEALIDAAKIFSVGRLPAGDRVAILTISGGTGVLMADACFELGLEVPGLSPETTEALGQLLPDYAGIGNPIDVTGAVLDDLSSLRRSLDLCVTDTSTDALLIAMGNVTEGEDDVVKAIIDVAASTDKPVIVSWVGGSGSPVRDIAAAGVPAYPDPTRAVQAAGWLVSQRQALQRHASPADAVLARTPEPT